MASGRIKMVVVRYRRPVREANSPQVFRNSRASRSLDGKGGRVVLCALLLPAQNETLFAITSYPRVAQRHFNVPENAPHFEMRGDDRGQKMTSHIEEECPLPPGENWDKADLLFLENAVARGMPFSEIGGFLCRTEEEVREKSKSLHAARGLSR
jgi:hypothetical protein